MTHVLDALHLRYLGVVDMVDMVDAVQIGGDSARSIEEQIIDHMEAAQLNNRLNGTRQVTVRVSKIGIKLVDVVDKSVVDRFALHKIVWTLSFDDGFGSVNVVFVVKKSTSDDVQCHLLRTSHGDAADLLCGQVRQAFHSAVVDGN